MNQRNVWLIASVCSKGMQQIMVTRDIYEYTNEQENKLLIKQKRNYIHSIYRSIYILLYIYTYIYIYINLNVRIINKLAKLREMRRSLKRNKRVRVILVKN